jgi:hypothetical protein
MSPGQLVKILCAVEGVAQMSQNKPGKSIFKYKLRLIAANLSVDAILHFLLWMNRFAVVLARPTKNDLKGHTNDNCLLLMELSRAKK